MCFSTADVKESVSVPPNVDVKDKLALPKLKPLLIVAVTLIFHSVVWNFDSDKLWGNTSFPLRLGVSIRKASVRPIVLCIDRQTVRVALLGCVVRFDELCVRRPRVFISGPSLFNPTSVPSATTSRQPVSRSKAVICLRQIVRRGQRTQLRQEKLRYLGSDTKYVSPQMGISQNQALSCLSTDSDQRIGIESTSNNKKEPFDVRL